MKVEIMMRLKGGFSPNVRGTDMGGVSEICRLSNHVPADLWTLPEQQGEGESVRIGQARTN